MTKKSSAPTLHSDIILIVLSRLPADSLVRCMCVCRCWYQIVRSDSLIRAHLRGLMDKKVRRVHSYSQDGMEIQHVDRGGLFLEEVPNVLPTIPPGAAAYSRIFGFCNGICCFSEPVSHDRAKIVLWNPLIRRRLDIGSILRNGEYQICWFGLFIKFCQDPKVYQGRWQIYNLGLKIWTNVDLDVGVGILESICEVFLNGAHHTIGRRYSDGRLRIIAFDFHRESLSTFDKPVNLLEQNGHADQNHETKLSVYKCSLHLVKKNPFKHTVIYSDGRVDGNVLEGVFWIWEMKQYGCPDSWSWLFSVDCGMGRPDSFFYFWKDGQMLLFKDQELFSYDPETEQFHGKGLHRARFWTEWVDTLTLLA